MSPDLVAQTSPILRVESVTAGYGHVGVLENVSIAASQGEIVAIVGSNGAGKSTLLRAISGLVRSSAGRIVFNGVDLAGARPDKVVTAGVLHVAEGRRLFRGQSVRDNLELGFYGERGGREVELERQRRVLELFPALSERMDAKAGVLSGGQQQMLAIGQALMRAPKLLMLDEPSLGLAPIVIDQVLDVVKRLARTGMTILLVEQMVERALEIANHVYVMRSGRVIGSGVPDEIKESALLRKAYLGAG
ncbi:MAG TPA: ABC transporter ATP-binding protein [Rhodoblastus sp.]|nr:ABC transporter ATP-binding protein [Rhodoblastus sp.]